MPNIFDREINKEKLRECQSGAYEAIINHFSSPNQTKNRVLIQLPTGTGKSALIAITPFKLCKSKVLILTPNLTLSEQLSKDLDIVNNKEENIYKRMGIFQNDELDEMELYVLKLNEKANFSDIEEHQIIVSNYQQLNDIDKWFKGREDIIDVVIIDEAHHEEANTYKKVIEFFGNAKIISLTATPFRSDGKKIEGDKIYTYHFSEAIKKEYIRNIKISNVSPKEISLSFSDNKNKNYTIDDIIEMKEEAWFRNGIALSQDCCDSIATKAYEKLIKLRTLFPGTSHQIIASAMSIRHAREFVETSFKKLGLRVGLISSQDKATNENVLDKLRQGKLDVIINIGMLGEGFDHKKLGVAAIFRPYATLNPYIQFIGRVIRSNENTKHCYVVSHLGLNQAERFKEFQLFDSDDKGFLETLLSESDSEKIIDNDEESFIKDEIDKKEDTTVLIKEIGTDVIEMESEFVKQDNLEKIAEQINNLSKEEKLKLFKNVGFDDLSINKKLKIKPIDKRIAAKSFLNEKEKSIAVDIIKNLGVKMYGRDFNPRSNNFVWIKSQISRDVNKFLEIDTKQRNKLSNEQLKGLEESGKLENIKNERLRYYKEKLK